ncbi:MAG: Crp/Fnr family transcriptional regulator [Amphritea sp.]|nr:Crp/Fnr family transcriptional regulator [Amphritea sp.]
MTQSAPKTIHCQNETRLYSQQDSHPWVYRLNEGFVLIDGISPDGKHGITDLYGPGSWFGPGLFGGGALQNAVAQEGCVLERYSEADFRSELNSNSALALEIISQLGVREQQLLERLFLQQTTALPARLVQLLCYLFYHQGQPCSHGHDRDVYLSQQDLADMVGGSRQSVSQLLASWKKAGAIDYSRDYICLEDVSKLRSFSEN